MYSSHSFNKSKNEDGRSPFRLFTEEGDVLELSPVQVFDYIEKFFGIISITGCVIFYTHLYNFFDFVIHKCYI